MLNRIDNLFALIAAVLITSAISGCDITLSPEERREKAITAIGVDASVTAAIVVSAVRSCEVVGVNNIEKCTQLKSSLITDQSAQMNARLATDMTNKYWDKCQSDFSQDYCLKLLQRALDIEYRKPRTSE